MTSITAQPWGTTQQGDEITLYTLTDGDEISVAITNYGGRVVSIVVPGRSGQMADVALGFDTVEGYLGDNPHFGSTVGRYANRIAQGRFKLGGREYQLPVNNGPNSLHGGKLGFDRKVWSPHLYAVGGDANHPGLQLAYTSPDGEEGYPGELDATVSFFLTAMDGAPALRIEYAATAVNEDTIVNLTNHSYFNLAGEGNGDILHHELMLSASHYTPTDAHAIPTGQIAPVEGTPFDFRAARTIGAQLDFGRSGEELRIPGGFDHNLVLDGGVGGQASFDNPPLAARLRDPASGRILEVYTDQPGVQFYTGNFLNQSVRGKHGHDYPRHGGICLETQHFPDSPNHPNFPTTVVRAGETRRFVTVWRFAK